MLNVVNANAGLLPAIFDASSRVPYYGKTWTEIEAKIREYSRTIARDAGLPLLALDTYGERQVTVGRLLKWVGTLLVVLPVLANAVGMLFFPESFFAVDIRSSLNRAAAVVVPGGGLFLLGMWFLARGKERLKAVAGKPSLDFDAGRKESRGYTALVFSRILLAVGLAIGVALNFAIVFVFGFPDLSGDLSSFMWFMIAMFSAVLPIFAGILLGRWATRLRQISAKQLSETDRRAPVLLLRSFKDEDITVYSSTANSSFSRLTLHQGQVRFEETIADQLSTVGPLIAIGKPGETLPQLGAARNYYADADWQDAIKRFLAESKLVVVIAGLTGGLRWELDHIVREQLLSKLIVVVPPSKAQQRWRTLREALSSALPPEALPARLPMFTRALHLDANGHLVAVRTWGSGEDSYERAIRLAIFGMFCAQDAVTPSMRAAHT